MSHVKIKSTKANEGRIKKHVKEFEQEYKFSDNLIYNGCIDAMKRVDLCKIGEKDVKGPLRTFLLSWGMMGRVLGRLEDDWEKDIAKVIKKNCKILNTFRKKNLVNFQLRKLDELDIENIKNCYNELREIVGPTSASKILHLICPNFFPLWDVDIRKEISAKVKGRGEYGIGDSGAGYYRFMLEIETLLNIHDRTLSKLSQKYGRFNMRLLDEHLWLEAHK